MTGEIGTGAVQLRWRTRAIGCLMPLILLTAGLFLAAAFSSEVAASLGDSGRRAAMMRMLAGVTVGGVNLPFLGLGLFLCGSLIQMGLRWADEIAVTAAADGLHFHFTLFRKALPWAEVAEVRAAARKAGLARVPALLVVRRDGRSFEVRGVDLEGGQGERFEAAVRERTSAALGRHP